MKPIIKLKTKQHFLNLAALVLFATLSTPASGHEAPANPFKMAVVIDAAYGRTVVSGEYDKAIERITAGRNKSRDYFSSQINLCVAYAKTMEIEKARTACDAAVAHLRKDDGRVSRIKNSRNPDLRAYRSNLSAALSNRGVLLAATGDTDLAREDFVAAINFDTGYSRIAAANLDRLAEIQVPGA